MAQSETGLSLRPFMKSAPGLHKYNWLNLHDKNEKTGLGPTSFTLNFEGNLDHCLDRKNINLNIQLA